MTAEMRRLRRVAGWAYLVGGPVMAGVVLVGGVLMGRT